MPRLRQERSSIESVLTRAWPSPITRGRMASATGLNMFWCRVRHRLDAPFPITRRPSATFGNVTLDKARLTWDPS